MRMQEYAVHADYAHIRDYADADENIIHIIHISIFSKNGNFLVHKWVSLSLFPILSAQNIISVHPTWFYLSSFFCVKYWSRNSFDKYHVWEVTYG